MNELLKKAEEVVTEAKKAVEDLKKAKIPQPAPVCKKDPVKVMEQVAKEETPSVTASKVDGKIPPGKQPTHASSGVQMAKEERTQPELIKFAPNGQWSLEKVGTVPAPPPPPPSGPSINPTAAAQVQAGFFGALGKEEGEKGQPKVAKVMRHFSEGKLHSGKSDKIVKDPQQAKAIAMSMAGLSKEEDFSKPATQDRPLEKKPLKGVDAKGRPVGLKGVPDPKFPKEGPALFNEEYTVGSRASGLARAGSSKIKRAG